MNTYKLSDVRQVCEVIYGRKIVDRTWRKWKFSLAIGGYLKEISQANMEQLITLANLKRSRPYDKIRLSEVIESKQATLQELQNTRNNYLLFLLPDECKGSTIPEIIYMVTGRKISQKTLYRWGVILNEQYKVNKNYKKDVLLTFISQAFMKPREKKEVHHTTFLEL
jgi:hypothetical protein